MAALDDGLARDLAATARDLGLDVLVEVHDRGELDRALRLDTRLIGINNRNLKTLKIDLQTTEELTPLVPSDRLVVAESGIYNPEDLDRLAKAGVRCFLVGEVVDAGRRCRGGDATTAAFAGPVAHRYRGPRPHGRCLRQGRDRPGRGRRRARTMRPETLARIQAGDVAKGDVLAVAQIAGIMAAKRTAELIPLCHPLR